MKSFLSAFGGNARTREEDNQYNFYNVLQPSLLCPLNILNVIRLSQENNSNNLYNK